MYVEYYVVLLFWQGNFWFLSRPLIGRYVRIDVAVLRRSHSNSQSMALAKKVLKDLKYLGIISYFLSSKAA